MLLEKGNTESVSDQSIDFISPANRYLKVLKNESVRERDLGEHGGYFPRTEIWLDILS